MERAQSLCPEGSRTNGLSGIPPASLPMACGILVPQPETHVPCTEKQILNHWITREVSVFSFYTYFYEYYNQNMSLIWSPLVT